jgi:two-component system chemotaxis sensor kinase CheA
MIEEKYLKIFKEESEELMERFNQALLDLENDLGKSEAIEEIFRVAHTFKGAAASLGFDKLSKFTHTLEGKLDIYRKGKALKEEVLDVLFQIADVLQEMVKASVEGKECRDGSEILSTLEQAIEESPTESLRDVSSGRELSTEVFLCKDIALKGARASLILKKLESFGEILKAVPSLEELKNGNFEDSFKIILRSNSSPREIKRAVELISDVERVDVVERREEKKLVESRSKIGRREGKKISIGETLKIKTSSLDNLIDLVGELLICHSRLERLVRFSTDMNLKDAVEDLRRIIRDLQGEVMMVRMVPVANVFNRFPRIVRDLSKELGKEVQFSVEGSEIELDRTVLDEISEPLLHILRNSLDHGIENPQERRKKGKPVKGKLKLIARKEKNTVLIEVEDDGRGMDAESIRRKAVEKGLISLEEARKIPDNQIIYFVCVPGFTTRENASTVSGRGVGMDVVKSKIQKMGGNLEIETELGKGTKVKMQLPLTLAIMQVLLVRIGVETLALPISSVEQVLRLDPKMIKGMGKNKVLIYQGRTVPLYETGLLLGLKERENKARYVIVVEVLGRLKGLLVDEVQGEQEIVIKSLTEDLSGVRGLGGATILGDGRPAFILDIRSLILGVEEGEKNEAL